MLVYGIIAGSFGVGCLWISGWHKLAGALAAIPVSMWLFGPQLSWALDQAIGRGRIAWRTFARARGNEYCPECHGVLAASADRPVSGRACPRCEGSWCATKDFAAYVAPYGASQATWLAVEGRPLERPMLCPRCAVPLELGTLERLQPVFARCEPCGGHWIERMSWTWFALTPPVPLKGAPAPASPEPALRRAP